MLEEAHRTHTLLVFSVTDFRAREPAKVKPRAIEPVSGPRVLHPEALIRPPAQKKGRKKIHDPIAF